MAEDLSESDDEGGFSFKNLEEVVIRHKFPLIACLIGLTLIALGVVIIKNGMNPSSGDIEVLEGSTEGDRAAFAVVEISGEVEEPGVYKLPADARIEDVLVAAKGITKNADVGWMEKYLNRAAKISDGQKIYIPSVNERLDGESAKNNGGYQTVSGDFSSRGSGLIDINTSSQKELESLYGIGPVYAQNIIEHRPYSNIEELVSKDVIPAKTYEKIKDEISTY